MTELHDRACTCEVESLRRRIEALEKKDARRNSLAGGNPCTHGDAPPPPVCGTCTSIGRRCGLHAGEDREDVDRKGYKRGFKDAEALYRHAPPPPAAYPPLECICNPGFESEGRSPCGVPCPVHPPPAAPDTWHRGEEYDDWHDNGDCGRFPGQPCPRTVPKSEPKRWVGHVLQSAVIPGGVFEWCSWSQYAAPCPTKEHITVEEAGRLEAFVRELDQRFADESYRLSGYNPRMGMRSLAAKYGVKL